MTGAISLLVFMVTTILVFLAYILFNRDNQRIARRARLLGGEEESRPKLGSRLSDALARMPLPSFVTIGSKAWQATMKARFARAGLYNPRATYLYLFAQFLLVSAAIVFTLGAGLANLIPSRWLLLSTVIAAAVGMLIPGMWLDSRISKWQTSLRRGLPDAMDLLVLCLEGGASFAASFLHVVEVLKRAHPDLGGELEIVQTEIMLGKTAGESMQLLAERADLEELHTLASVLIQNERYGVSVAKALRIHADAMRQQKLQRSEEAAQQAAVKILFPTLLFIFPAIFIVVLGPAALRIMAVMSKMN